MRTDFDAQQMFTKRIFPTSSGEKLNGIHVKTTSVILLLADIFTPEKNRKLQLYSLNALSQNNWRRYIVHLTVKCHRSSIVLNYTGLESTTGFQALKLLFRTLSFQALKLLLGTLSFQALKLLFGTILLFLCT